MRYQIYGYCVRDAVPVQSYNTSSDLQDAVRSGSLIVRVYFTCCSPGCLRMRLMWVAKGGLSTKV